MGWSRNVKSIGKQLKAGIQWKDNSERSAISDTDYCSTSTAYPLAILRNRIALRSFPRVSRKFCLVKKRKSSLVGDLLKEDSGSLNRSMRVFCWITEEHQESYSLRHPLQRKSIHILFGRIRYLIISSEEE